MAVFDPNNPPTAPDSTLDSDISSQQGFIIQDQSEQPIALGDWVDVDPSAVSADPNWGWSFQVVGLHPNESVGLQAVDILLTADNGQTYAPSQLSCSWITANYRRVPQV